MEVQVTVTRLCCCADDRSAGGQNDPDTDRGLRRCRQLALLSGHGSRVHQVGSNGTFDTRRRMNLGFYQTKVPAGFPSALTFIIIM